MNNTIGIEYHWCGKVRTLYFMIMDGMTYLMKPQTITPLNRKAVKKIKGINHMRAELDMTTNTIQLVN